MSLVCPKCGRDDSIRKVSSIVEQGTSAGASEIGYSVVQSGLAARLAMPVPSVPNNTGIGCLGAIAVFGLLLFVSNLGNYADGFTPVFFVVVLVLAPVAGIGLLWKRRHDNQEDERFILNALYSVWRDVYYCSRDDIVFWEKRPTTYAPTTRLLEYIDEMYGKEDSATGTT